MQRLLKATGMTLLVALALVGANTLVTSAPVVAALTGQDEVNTQDEVCLVYESDVPTRDTPGYNRDNPAAVGTSLISLRDGFETRVTLHEIMRGEEAWNRIRDTSRLADPAEAGSEYIIARGEVEVLRSHPDFQLRLRPGDFDAVSGDGLVYDSVGFGSRVAPTLEGNLYSGASHEGWVTVSVAEGDTRPVLAYGRGFQGEGGVWWLLGEEDLPQPE